MSVIAVVVAVGPNRGVGPVRLDEVARAAGGAHPDEARADKRDASRHQSPGPVVGPFSSVAAAGDTAGIVGHDATLAKDRRCGRVRGAAAVARKNWGFPGTSKLRR